MTSRDVGSHSSADTESGTLSGRQDDASDTGFSFENYYDLLGVSETASNKAIRQAYRERAKELHPDSNSADNAREQFNMLTRARDILLDSELRRRYDKLGHHEFLRLDYQVDSTPLQATPEAGEGSYPGAVNPESLSAEPTSQNVSAGRTTSESSSSASSRTRESLKNVYQWASTGSDADYTGSALAVRFSNLWLTRFKVTFGVLAIVVIGWEVATASIGVSFPFITFGGTKLSLGIAAIIGVSLLIGSLLGGTAVLAGHRFPPGEFSIFPTQLDTGSSLLLPDRIQQYWRRATAGITIAASLSFAPFLTGDNIHPWAYSDYLASDSLRESSPWFWSGWLQAPDLVAPLTWLFAVLLGVTVLCGTAYLLLGISTRVWYERAVNDSKNHPSLWETLAGVLTTLVLLSFTTTALGVTSTAHATIGAQALIASGLLAITLKTTSLLTT